VFRRVGAKVWCGSRLRRLSERLPALTAEFDTAALSKPQLEHLSFSGAPHCNDRRTALDGLVVDARRRALEHAFANCRWKTPPQGVSRACPIDWRAMEPLILDVQ
jgi:hypothetical protein